ncbi:EIN3-binding F-box protein 2-like [Typha latifolia]|uniref:EIN3-binding F-box protein 2-like n=1 Tax=Typha latifolia TaxID=4733 RepID=UPI003C2F9CCD
MAALLNYGGNDVLPFFLDAPKLRGFYHPAHKRPRFALFAEEEEEEEEKPSCFDSLPNEILFEILRRLPGSRERSASACVSKRWLAVLTTIRSSDIVKDEEGGEEQVESDGFLTRDFEGEVATDVSLAAMAIATRGGLRKLSVEGSNLRRGVTDCGLAAVASGCPSLRVLSVWSVPLVTDAGLSEIAKGCPMLEKLDLSQCPLISDEGLIAIAQNCLNLTSLTIESCANVGNEGLQAIGRHCPKLRSLTIKDCPLVGDQGIAGLVSSSSSTLARITLQGLPIGDASLGFIGYYGNAVVDLTLSRLENVGERGFWVMANALRLRKLKSLAINSCGGVTDLALGSIAKCCPSLKHLRLRRCCYITDAGMRAFAGEATELESLQLEECDRVTLIGVLAVLVVTEIKKLSLVKCLGIKDTGNHPATQLPSCKSLRSLKICSCPGFTNDSLALVGKLCPQLEAIDLSGFISLSDDGLLPLIGNSAAGLVEVNLSGCINLTDTTIATLVEKHGATLKLLNLDGCTNVTDNSVLEISDRCCVLEELDMSRSTITDYGVAILVSARQLSLLRILSLAGCCKVTQKSLPLLGNMGRSLEGLNLQFCNLISAQDIGLLEEKLWWCDILS